MGNPIIHNRGDARKSMMITSIAKFMENRRDTGAYQHKILRLLIGGMQSWRIFSIPSEKAEY